MLTFNSEIIVLVCYKIRHNNTCHSSDQPQIYQHIDIR